MDRRLTAGAPSGAMPGLSLVPIYLSGRTELLAALRRVLSRTFRLEVRQHPPWFDPEAAFDPSRAQYSSTRFLELLLSGGRTGAGRILGITDVDLFIPILTYVFGEAQLQGRAAVVSTHRLDPRAYGLPSDPVLLTARTIKEAVHELGHTYGLLHCLDPACAMHASTYVEEIDLKGDALCPRCRRALDPEDPGPPRAER